MSAVQLMCLISRFSLLVIKSTFALSKFPQCSGYHVRLTRGRLPVQAGPQTFFFFRLGATKPKKYIYQFRSFKFQLGCNSSLMNWWQSKAIRMNKTFMFKSLTFFGRLAYQVESMDEKTNKQTNKQTRQKTDFIILS